MNARETFHVELVRLTSGEHCPTWEEEQWAEIIYDIPRYRHDDFTPNETEIMQIRHMTRCISARLTTTTAPEPPA